MRDDKTWWEFGIGEGDEEKKRMGNGEGGSDSFSVLKS